MSIRVATMLDPRFAVLPGVLHTEAVWGNGTTEYALDALLAAPHQASKLGLPVGEAFKPKLERRICPPGISAKAGKPTGDKCTSCVPQLWLWKT